MIKFLPKHPLYSAFDSFTEVVPMVIMSKCAFSAFRPRHNYQEIHLNLVDDSLVVLTKEKFILTIILGVLPSTMFHTPSTTNVFTTLYQMGYQKKLKGVAEFKRNQLPSVWQFVCHYVIRCLSGRTGCTDNMGIKLLEIIWSIFMGNAVNYGQILWDDFLQYVSKDAPKEGMNELTFARFWSLCIFDLQKDAKLSLGKDTNLFSSRDLKRYIASKDQTMFGPLRRLPMHIVESIGLATIEVADHIQATSDIDSYHSSRLDPVSIPQHKTPRLPQTMLLSPNPKKLSLLLFLGRPQ